MIDLRTPDDRDQAAAEYVLGTLSDADRSAVEQALASDPALQAAVYAWQDRLLPLSVQAAPQAPSPAVWSRIEAGLDAATTPVAAPAPAAPRRRPAAADAPRWWQRLGFWQGLSGLAVAASVLLAVLLVQQRAGLPEARYLALLQAPQTGSTGWLVEVQAGGQLKLLPVGEGAAAPVPAGRALQFWTKLDGAAGPTSLGLVQAGQPLVLPVAKLPGVGARQLFEITLEPEGGSTIGRPTGPILYVGRTLQL